MSSPRLRPPVTVAAPGIKGGAPQGERDGVVVMDTSR